VPTEQILERVKMANTVYNTVADQQARSSQGGSTVPNRDSKCCLPSASVNTPLQIGEERENSFWFECHRGLGEGGWWCWMSADAHIGSNKQDLWRYTGT